MRCSKKEAAVINFLSLKKGEGLIKEMGLI